MTKSHRNYLLIAAGSVLILLILFLVLKINLKSDDNNEFITELKNIEKNISSGFYEHAEEQLVDQYTKIKNSTQALMFLKRCLSISEKTEDYDLFFRYSERLYERFKRNIEIAAVYSYALQKGNNYKKSFIISDKKIKKSDYKSIYYLNVLKNNYIPEEKKTRENLYTNYAYRLNRADLNPELITSLYDLYKNEKYLVDLALISAAEGAYGKALDYIHKTAEADYSEIKMLLYYENGDMDNAEKYLEILKKNRSELSRHYRLFECDVLLNSGREKEAEINYEKFISEYPDYSSIPYRNLYSINRNNSKGLDFLEKGLFLFPESGVLNQSFAWNLYIDNDYSELDEIINTYENENIGERNSTLSLLYLSVSTIGRNPEHIIGQLWNLFNIYPESETVCRYFANYLLNNNRTDTLNILIDRYIDENYASDWCYCYKAVGYTLAGDFKNAEENINSAIAMNDNLINNYNKSYILMLQERYSESVNVLEKLVAEMNNLEDSKKYLSEIYLKLSESYYNLNDYKSAYYYIMQSKDLEPGNFKSNRLYNKIKEEYND